MSADRMECPQHEGALLVAYDGAWYPDNKPGTVCTSDCVPGHLRGQDEEPDDVSRLRARVDQIKFEMDAREQAEDERHRAEDLPLVWDDEDEFEEMLGQVVWGTEGVPFANTGEPLVISSADGLGKTTIAQDYVRARLGLHDDMWGAPVVPLPEDENVLYLAFDRYSQIRAAFRRGPVVKHRVAFAKQPMYPLRSAKAGRWLLEKVREVSAGLVVVDSLKDQVNPNDPTELGRFWDNLKPLGLAGIEVVVLSHTNKTKVDPENPKEAVSGHRLATSSAGSVFVIDGSTGKPPHTVYHAKALRGDTIPSALLSFNHETGRTSLEYGEGVIVDLSKAPAWAWTKEAGVKPQQVNRILGAFAALGNKEALTSTVLGCSGGEEYKRGVKVMNAMAEAGLLTKRKDPKSSRGTLWAPLR